MTLGKYIKTLVDTRRACQAALMNIPIKPDMSIKNESIRKRTWAEDRATRSRLNININTLDKVIELTKKITLG